MYFLAVIKNSKSLFVSCQCHCIRYKSSKSVKEETTNIFCRCFGRDMLFSKLDTFYGPAVSYIQFPNTHIAILEKQGHRHHSWISFPFKLNFNATLKQNIKYGVDYLHIERVDLKLAVRYEAPFQTIKLSL